jgi:hypothetical protein
MTLEICSPNVAVRDTGTVKGRGVYALRPFNTGDIVEESIVLIVWYDAIPEVLKNIVFNWEALTITQKGSALALGFGSMYNHANPANLKYVPDTVNQSLRFIAVKDIQVGEELTINYNAIDGGPNSEMDHWFSERKIEPA